MFQREIVIILLVLGVFSIAVCPNRGWAREVDEEGALAMEEEREVVKKTLK